MHNKLGTRDIVYRSKTTHSHAPDIAKVKAQRVRQTLRERAREGKEPDHRVLGDVCQGLDDNVLSQLPNGKSLKKVVVVVVVVLSVVVFQWRLGKFTPASKNVMFFFHAGTRLPRLISRGLNLARHNSTSPPLR